MKKVLAIALCLALVTAFAGCGPEKKSYDASEYILETDWKDDFKILQLTDTHIANKDNRQLQYDFIRLTVEDAKPDMIVVVGDMFTFADKTVAKEYFAFLDSFGVPWSVTLGNHDEQCYFSVDWMTDLLNNYGGNCIFRDLQDDDVFGNSNYAVNLRKDGKTVWQLILFDSNRYNYGEYWGYDYIKEDQIDWYEGVVKYTEAQEGRIVPSVAFFHIPLPEFLDAWNETNGDGYEKSSNTFFAGGVKQEGVCAPDINTGLFDKMLQMGSTKAVCVGHDHVNNFKVLYKGIYLCYGVNSTDRIYYDENLLGGRLITLHEDGGLEFADVLHSYSEVK